MDFGALIGSLLGKGKDSPVKDAAPDIANPQVAKTSFLDNVTKTIMGRADQDLTPEELRQRNQRRAAAANMANSAAESPGEGFMSAPAGSGSGFGLQDIAAFAKSLF